MKKDNHKKLIEGLKKTRPDKEVIKECIEIIKSTIKSAYKSQSADKYQQISHDAVLKIKKSIPSYKEEGKFEKFAKDIARKTAIDWLRSERRLKKIKQVEEIWAQVNNPYDSLFSQIELQDFISKSVSDETDRLICWYIWDLGLTIKETAEKLEISCRTIKRRKAKIIKHLELTIKQLEKGRK